VKSIEEDGKKKALKMSTGALPSLQNSFQAKKSNSLFEID